jgi:hydrogenase nickel incorporation protein HypB
MCTTCGCGEPDVRIETGELHRHADGTVHSHPHDHAHPHHHGHDHGHGHHDHDHDHHHDHDHDHDARTLRIERDILEKNDAIAATNRAALAANGIFALNLVSSPGSGKTTLLVRTIEALRDRLKSSVIEGDQQTSVDAERVRATGAPAVQVNTGKGCHLDAQMVARAMRELPLDRGGVLFIENVGNLVCPAAFDLGEAHKVVVLSVTEGEDKPLKYPDMFRRARLMLLNKIDLLPHVEFDVARAIEYARRANPEIEVLQVSARSGEGMDAWVDWLEAGAAAAHLRVAEAQHL